MKRVLVLLLAVVLASAAQATVVTLGSDADTWVRDGSSDIYGADPSMYLVAGPGRVGYIRFDLSSLGDVTIQSATLTFTKATAPWGRSDTIVTGRFALTGLDNIEGNTAQDWNEAGLGDATVGAEFVGGGEPVDLTKVTNLDMEDGIDITETVTGGLTVTITGNALVDFLQARVNDGGLVTVIAAFPGTDNKGYWLAAKEYGDETARPVLEVTYIPEPATVTILGLGLLMFRRRK